MLYLFHAIDDTLLKFLNSEESFEIESIKKIFLELRKTLNPVFHPKSLRLHSLSSAVPSAAPSAATSVAPSAASSPASSVGPATSASHRRGKKPPRARAPAAAEVTVQYVLKRAGLPHLYPLFVEQEVDLAVLATLKEDDLKEVGVTEHSDRVKILKYVKRLKL